MATTFTINSNGYQGRYLQLVCTQTKNIANNTSTINWTLSALGGSSSYYSTGATTVTIGGQQVYYKERVSWNTQTFPAAKGSVSGSLVIQHNTDGSASVDVSLSTAIYTSTQDNQSDTWILDSNPRGATITAAPNFNDEENPTITYSNLAGNAVDNLETCIASADGLTVYIPYRSISKTDTSYTFTLTDTERNTLRNATKNSNTMQLRFYIRTTIGTAEFKDRVEKTLTIINCKPTLNPTVVDTDATALTLTGDNSKFIKYYSNAQISTGATARKNATLESQKVTCGGKSITSASGLIGDVESATFVFNAADSRGNTTTQTVNKTLINYVKLTCNLNVPAPSAEGETTLTITGNYFNGSFGAVSNTLTVQYRVKESNGEYGSWIAVTATKSGNTYRATVNITGLDYQKYYTYQARAIDKLATVNSSEKKVKTLPLFDWGENDFNFNVPVKLNNIYNLTGVAKAMTHPYTLTTTHTATSNYTINKTEDAILIGNNLRCYFYVTRATAVTGNVTNEKVLTLKIKHDGKIRAVYGDLVATTTTGAVTCFYISNTTRDDTYISFDINLAATTNEGINFDSYFTLPVLIDTNKY